ncbi:succinate-semialdehyde dehydrogenase/glutarate-semialdehyde dehydrogenase [Micromonospora sagamiensis]|uniref:Succinate-semialdehyde dehydrogenase/glutarate-semialdehyde dehydrogenase n=1 Tax=Micromonospora sagamiensis TaxID=47875 RepID=A0A562WJ23_9ACTN|nr:succinate-semialdehyde dehydrogenase/glutarate-semialdehyde dehydrogenase [Micromonospora sagamiensis]
MQRAMWRVEQLIGGVWGAGGAGGEFVVTDPADGTDVSTVPTATEDEVAKAVGAARGVAATWAATDPAERAAALRRAADAVEAVAEELAQATTAEMGKPLLDARGGVAAGVGTLRQYAELGPLRGGRTLHGGRDAVDFMAPEPRGVVAVITPWNDPVAVACGLLGAALVTGNVVVFKPSERTPATGWLLARALDGELPAGVLSLLTGDARVGAALAAQEVDVVAHVGSTATGRAIASACARTGAKALLENGGSDPLIVDAGVDPVWAAGQAAMGAFANAGQLCVAVERIYVHREVAGDVVPALVDLARAMRIGPGQDGETEIGPLVDRRHRDHVHGQVLAAVAEGARVLTGGAVPAGPGPSTRRPWSPTAPTGWRWSARRPSARSRRCSWWTRSPRRWGGRRAHRTGWPPRCSPPRWRTPSGRGASCRSARSRSTRCSAARRAVPRSRVGAVARASGTARNCSTSSPPRRSCT